MPTKKVRDLPQTVRCADQDHEPSSLKLYADGVYEHTCPTCGNVERFTVKSATL